MSRVQKLGKRFFIAHEMAQGFDYQNDGVLLSRQEMLGKCKRWFFRIISTKKYLPIGFNDKQRNSILDDNDIPRGTIIVGASIADEPRGFINCNHLMWRNIQTSLRLVLLQSVK